ncbi:hypothetical protein [Dokdonella ginsengisoli]|uniref:ANTAR domain-containing protein n=1 Tax=Dokdonella ginsengisoli TaxID=363846 RepID=A0ABV9R046_9GAMM
MANILQKGMVSLLGSNDERAAHIFISDTLVAALLGDEGRASAAFATLAEVFRQGRSLPAEFAPLVAVLLDRAATSEGACKAISRAEVRVGRRKNADRDSLIVAQERVMRHEVSKKSARMAILAGMHSLSVNAVKTILDADVRRWKEADEVIKRADALIAATETEDAVKN